MSRCCGESSAAGLFQEGDDIVGVFAFAFALLAPLAATATLRQKYRALLAFVNRS